MSEAEIGVVTHYFDKIGVGAIKVTVGELAVGDTLHIKGHTTDLTMTVDSMQVEHAKVPKAGVGDVVGMKVPGKVHEHDKVYKVTP
jgi:translation elongation factor EF-1alpha